jgi:hypothetical protein
MNDHHQVEWIPPPHLDTGQARINHYHRPESLFCPTDEAPEPQRDNDTTPEPDMTPEPAPDEQASDIRKAVDDPWAPDASAPPRPDRSAECAPESFDPWSEDGTRTLIDDKHRPDPLLDPWGSGDSGERGGPEPNTP